MSATTPDAVSPTSEGRVLVVGVTSPVARAVSAEFAREGRPLLLAARDAYELQAVSADLRIRYGVDVRELLFDALDFDDHERLFAEAEAAKVTGVVVALGTMGDQAQSQRHFDAARAVLDTNYLACVSVCEGVATLLEQGGDGFICGITSVAGDRGRQSNYLYGSAKAGWAAYLSGLRNRLHSKGIAVTTVKPGFMDTRMTYGLPGTFLVMSPEAAGKSVHGAIRRKRAVVYVPWFWRLIMGAIRSIPEPLFKRMKL